MEHMTPSAGRIQWPANQRAALIVLIHVDAPDFDAGPGSAADGLDYTATGLHRLLTAFADLDIPTSTAWTKRALSTYPQLARSAQDHGHELAMSQIDGTDPDDSVLARISDIPVLGVVQSLPIPGASATSSSQSNVHQMSGLTWSITGVGGDLPIQTAGEGQDTPSTVIPVSPYWVDLPWLDPERPLPPSSLLEAWSLALAAVRTEGGLMTIVIHPHVSGRLGLAGIVTRFMDEAIESGDVWIATAAQVAEWWQRQNDGESQNQ